MKLLFLALTFLLSKKFSECLEPCKICPDFHPQQIFCNSRFVGIIEITEVNLNRTVLIPSSSNSVTAQGNIKQIYKGEYQDFVIGSAIYIYAPINESCQREYWRGEFLISGDPLNGGLLSTKCSLMEELKSFKPQQLETIESHIHTRAYERGCRLCTIKRPYDYSIVERNQCRYEYKEFPISTSVCIASGESRFCSFETTSKTAFVLPPQPPKRPVGRRDFVIAQETGKPVEKKNCLLDKIIQSTTKAKESTTTRTPTTTMKSFFITVRNSFLSPRMRIKMDWRKANLPSWVYK